MTRSINTLACLCVATSAVQAGTIASGPAYLANVTAPPGLAANNDDYTGAFANNPNKAQINPFGDIQSLGSTERLIPTTPSGGITEYAVTVGASLSHQNENLDGVFKVQLGFGTGANSVPASLVTPGLRFDTSENVNPAVPNFGGLLTLIDHEADTLTFQGSSAGGFFREYSGPEILKFPLDVPDLDPSLRERFYSPAQLARFPAGTVPFTFRAVEVPEPWSLCLVGVALALAWPRLMKPLRQTRQESRHVFQAEKKLQRTEQRSKAIPYFARLS
jgi:hypothetical protein